MIYLLLCLYAFKHGQTNAILYSRLGADALPRNEHEDLVQERALLVMSVILASFYPYALVLVEVVAFILAFSFFHNGAYYVMRNRIDWYAIDNTEWKYDWDDIKALWTHQSPTSTAKLEFSYKERTLLLFASFGILLIGYIAILQ
jgi:hypothetical protein